MTQKLKKIFSGKPLQSNTVSLNGFYDFRGRMSWPGALLPPEKPPEKQFSWTDLRSLLPTLLLGSYKT